MGLPTDASGHHHTQLKEAVGTSGAWEGTVSESVQGDLPKVLPGRCREAGLTQLVEDAVTLQVT